MSNKSIFGNIPPEKPDDIITWAEENVKMIGSVITETFDRSTAPWTIDPIRWQADKITRRTTYIKPVQSCGSGAGEVALCYWARFGYGKIQFNWHHDTKARDKWRDRILPILEACKDLEFFGGRFDTTKCYAKFISTDVQVQGVYGDGRLDSNSIPYQLNEEGHIWPDGGLAKARGRQTAVFMPKAFDISNASNKGDQLNAAFDEGTQQEWEVLCPGCGKFHRMRTRWEDKHPELGGLRYDSKDAKLENGLYNYSKILPTIRFQMPCGAIIGNNLTERRRLSLKGRYSEPREGAYLPYRSARIEAVACHGIDWLTLIQEKHAALRARRLGDMTPWANYLKERECRFYDQEDAPLQGTIIVTSSSKKNRDGLRKNPEFFCRFFAADYQHGVRERGEFQHFWLVIRDVLASCDSELVSEGMIQTEGDLLARLQEHECNMWEGCIDATHDPDRIRSFCLKHGINSVIGGNRKTGNNYFMHPDEKGNATIPRIYSIEEPLHKRMSMLPKFSYELNVGGHEPAREEPREWFYHKSGIITKLDWLRNNGAIKHEVPGDVSEDYQKQNESWEKVREARGLNNDIQEFWKKIKRDDHLFICEGYIAMMMDMSGVIAARMELLQIPNVLGPAPGLIE